MSGAIRLRRGVGMSINVAALDSDAEADKRFQVTPARIYRQPLT